MARSHSARSHSSARAPAGAVALAARVDAMVKELGGPKAAANLLKMSASRVSQMAKASSEGRPIGKIISTPKGLAAWEGRLKAAARLAPEPIAKVIRGEKKPEHHERARGREGKRNQDIAGSAKAQYTPSQLAKAAGVSHQKITAIERKMLSGKPITAEEKEIMRRALEGAEAGEGGIRDGIKVSTREQYEKDLAKMTPAQRAENDRHKCFGEWAGVINWFSKVAGSARACFRAVNLGTPDKPCWNVYMVSPCKDEGEEDEEEEDEEGEEGEE